MNTHARELIHREEVELKRRLALLAQAIARFERWYALQEAGIVAFDRDAAHVVDRLRTGGWVAPSLKWHPSRVAAAHPAA